MKTMDMLAMNTEHLATAAGQMTNDDEFVIFADCLCGWKVLTNNWELALELAKEHNTDYSA